MLKHAHRPLNNSRVLRKRKTVTHLRPSLPIRVILTGNRIIGFRPISMTHTRMLTTNRPFRRRLMNITGRRINPQGKGTHINLCNGGKLVRDTHRNLLGMNISPPSGRNRLTTIGRGLSVNR